MCCKKWQTNDRIQNKYGEGEGICEVLNDVTFCDKTACLCFDENTDIVMQLMLQNSQDTDW